MPCLCAGDECVSVYPNSGAKAVSEGLIFEKKKKFAFYFLYLVMNSTNEKIAVEYTDCTSAEG